MRSSRVTYSIGSKLTSPQQDQNNAAPPEEQIRALIAHYNQEQFQLVLDRGAALAAEYPDLPFIRNLLGAANDALGRAEKAVECFNEAIALQPDYAEAHVNCGIVLHELARFTEAEASYLAALRFAPDIAETHNRLGIVQNELGKHDAAVASYREALRLQPDRAQWHWNLSTAWHYRAGDPHIEQMLQLLARPALPSPDRMRLSFALGKAFNEAGLYDQAIAYLLEGNRLRKAELRYDSSADRALFAKIKATFSENVCALDNVAQAQDTISQRPIFILGMPRSGTTLVEQILASHSQVHWSGELTLLGQLVRSIEWKPPQIGARSLQAIRTSYLAGLSKINSGKGYVTDKMPHNFLWIGFIMAAIPEARIVHVQRDARATCWSNFKHGFFDKGYGFACDLRDVAEHYRMYADLMAFWHEHYPGSIYDLNYEKLTAHQEAETRRLLDFVGLDWEAQCLAFHKTRRAIRTASAQQVRQKMYQGSSEDWRNYAAHLGPMIELLKDF